MNLHILMEKRLFGGVCVCVCVEQTVLRECFKGGSPLRSSGIKIISMVFLQNVSFFHLL